MSATPKNLREPPGLLLLVVFMTYVSAIAVDHATGVAVTENDLLRWIWRMRVTNPAEKAVKIGPSYVVKWKKRNSRRASKRF
jgi:hypothetical protein